MKKALQKILAIITLVSFQNAFSYTLQGRIQYFNLLQDNNKLWWDENLSDEQISIIANSSIIDHQGPQSTKKLCEKQNDPDYYKSRLITIDNMIAFENQPGRFNTGLCWWTSRLQRNSLYIAYFSPEKEKPTFNQAKKIIKDIIKLDGFVEIPGFKNFYNFTKNNKEAVISALSDIEAKETLLLGWVSGLKGPHQTSSEKLNLIMEQLYQSVQNENKIIYQMLQKKGLSAHAWLVVDMIKIEDGYEILALDSFTGLVKSIYKNGDTYLLQNYSKESKDNFKFVPYTQKDSELNKIEQIYKKDCKE